MPAPVAIIDALESVLDIFLSGVRHRERAAFILCDNLVEMACKAKAKQHDPNFNMRSNFHDSWNAPGVTLDPHDLGRRVQDHHAIRNNMQHASPAATVDPGYCATAIVDTVEVIETLWPGSPLSARVRCALRIVRLYTAAGDPALRDTFENKMRRFSWRTQNKEAVRANAAQIEPGLRDSWWWTLRHRQANIEGMLDEIGAP